MDRREQIARRKARLSPAQQALLARRLAGDAAAPEDIPRRPVGAPAPLSFTQERFWFIDRLEPGAATYVVCKAFRLEGPLDRDRLALALDTVVARHAALRTVFVDQNGTPEQRILPPERVTLVVTPAPDRAAVEAAVRAGVARGMNLATGPLYRFQLFRLGAEEHLLTLVVHHAVFDGWSAAVFVRDLAAAYTGAALPPLSIDVADYAVWERARAAGDALASQRTFWQTRLAGLPPLDLPTDHPRTAVQSYRGALYRFTLSPEQTAGLRALAREADGTLFMVLLALFQVLLHRYSGQDDVAVGCPVSGRTHAQTEDLVGCFIRTLVMRADLSGDPTFRGFLDRVRAMTLEALAHQDLPFEQVVEAVNPPRDLSRPPLFQVVFQLRNLPQADASGDGVTIREEVLDGGVALYDLEWDVAPVDGGLECRLIYNADLFERETMARMAGHYGHLLTAILADPDCPLSALDLLSDAERHQVLVGWNDTARPLPQGTVVSRFEAQAARAPDAEAVREGDRRWTTGALDARANRLARRLREAGVTPGTRVGVYLPRGASVVAALLGIWKAGAVYVPLDPAYPPDRLAFMAEDAAVAVVLTDEATWHAAPLPAGTPLFVTPEPEASKSSVPPRSIGPDDPAYIVYTSGSTGRPKGALIPHRQIVNRVTWMAREYPFAPGEVVAQKTALSFVDSISEMVDPLLAGVPLAILSDEDRLDPVRFVERLAAYRVSRLWVVPSQLAVLLNTFPDLGRRLPNLTFWVTTGEAIAPDLYRRFQAVMPHARLFNLYGTSEVWDVTWQPPVPLDGDGPVPIGRPIDNMRVYVLDAARRPVPVGVPGELYVGGVGLATAYVNRPDLTAERFVPDPFSPGERLYRTGDRARFRPDGSLVFLGRMDHQFKWRGYRIEPAEIEARLREVPGVRDAVVMLRKAAGVDVLAAYVVPEDGAPVEDARLRAALQRHLPAYMVPSVFVTLPAFPLTPSGKVDRQAMPAPEPARAAGHRPPANEVERRLARLWEAVLGVRPVGRDDDFFELGGHSLLAAGLFDRIQQEFGVRLPLMTLFQAPTVGTLSRHLLGEGVAAPLVPIQPRGSRPPLFCVPPAGSSVVGFAPLAEALGPDQPLFGLEPVGLDGRQAPHAGVKKMARYYLEAVRTHQPTGPYYLAGRCFGGVVAFEMAHQLRAAGEEVAFVGLFDTGMPGPRTGRDAMRRSLARRGAPSGRFRRRLRRLVKKTRRGLNILRIRIFGNTVERIHRHVLDTHKQAMRHYVPEPFPGRLVYFHPEEEGPGRLNPALWASLAEEGLTCVPVPGSHQTMMRPPHVTVLADRLRECLCAARPALPA